jgi:hypothetical protein
VEWLFGWICNVIIRAVETRLIASLLKTGESQTVTFTITPDKLGFFNKNMKKKIVESGGFMIMVGTSSVVNSPVKVAVID